MRTPPLVVLVAEAIVRAEYERQFAALEARMAEIRQTVGGDQWGGRCFSCGMHVSLCRCQDDPPPKRAA